MRISDVVKGESQKPEALAHKIRKAIKGKSVSLAELSSKFDRGVGQIRAALDLLATQGYHVRIASDEAEIVRDLPTGAEHRIEPRLYKGKEYVFGICSDNHLCSKYSRLDVLNAVYDIFAEEGVSDVYNAGNIVDGECRFNRHDLIVRAGMAPQLAYAAEHYPQRKGITTHYIVANDHEGWWAQREGVDVGRAMQTAFEDAGRKDMHYLGYLEADIRLKRGKGETWLRVLHAGGGSAYALSYAPQKIVESFQGGEKPAILIIGHYHKFEFCCPREVYCISAGCTQDQTPFMRSHKIQAYVGGLVCRAILAPDGHVSSLSVDWRRFYDRGFYEGKEKFKRW